MPAWPDTLPQVFEARGFSDGLPEQLIRSTLDGGREKTRRLARHENVSPISGRMLVTQEQARILLEFYRMGLSDGIKAFDFPSIDDPDATVPVTFESPPTFTNIGGTLYAANLQLERVGRQSMTEAMDDD